MKFYKNAFMIKGAIGNNEFSFDERKEKHLIVPALLKSEYPVKLKEGKVSFCEIDDGVEHSCKGLEYFYQFKFKKKNIYIFDNHNHSFFFTIYEQVENEYKDLKIIHIDQHKDMRSPNLSFEEYKKISKSERHDIITNNTEEFMESYNSENQVLDLAYEYCNLHLNVGNYIIPLLDSKFVKDVYIIDSQSSLNDIREGFESNYCLNIDLDFFSKDMDYINFELKIEKIKEIMKNAKFITISTSPYFVDLSRCITALKAIFE